MRYENNEHLKRWLLEGGAGEYLHMVGFDFEPHAFERVYEEVRQQHPALTEPEAKGRAAYRLLTKPASPPERWRMAEGEAGAPVLVVARPGLRYRILATFKRHRWRIVQVLWALAVLGALLFLAAHAKAQETPRQPAHQSGGAGPTAGWHAARLAEWRGRVKLYAQVGQPSGIILQLQNQGSVLATRPAGLVVLNCSTNMTCSFSGTTFTITSSATAGTAWSSLTAPTVNLSMAHGAFTTTFTWGAATGAVVNLFNLTDTLNNSGTGFMFNVNLALGSALKPAQFAVNGNGVTVSNAGLLAKIGTGGLDYGSLLSFPAPCGANLFATQIAATPGCTQPSFANLLGVATKPQLPATTVFTDQANTFGAFPQDFEGASVTRPFRRLAFASFPATCTINREFLERSDPAVAGQVVYVCNAAGTGWDLIGDGGTGSGITTLNTLTAATQTFAKVDDTNVTLGISSATSTHTFTMGWAGTLAKARTLGTTVYTDQANTFGLFLQKFRSGANFQLSDPTDATKLAQFDLANLTTLTTRTINVPDANSTLAQAFSAPANQFLTAISAQGVFSAAQVGFSNLSGSLLFAQTPLTTRGDLLTVNVTPALVRLARGAANLYPKSDGLDVVYSTLAAAGVGGCTNQFPRTLNADAAPTCASIVKADLPAATVFTDQTNTYTTGTQDFESAAVTRPLRRLAFASFPATCTTNREFLERSDPATAGQVVYVCNAAGTGWDLVGDGGGGGGVPNPAANGMVACTGTACSTSAARTITGTAGNVTVTNGDGVAGNPTLDLGTIAVQTDQTNTYSAGTQDFESAAVSRPFRRLAFASFPATCTANREFLERSDPATAGQVVYVCNAAGTGWDLVGDGGGGGGSDAENVVKLAADVTNTTTTLADTTGLSFTAAANTTYLIEIWVTYTTAATTTGINLSVNGPATPTSISFLRFTGLSTNAGAVSNFNAYDAGTANASALSGVNTAIVEAVLANAGTSGTFILRFASEVATSAVTIKAGSTLRFRDTAVAGGGGGGSGYNQVTDSKGGALTQRTVLFAADGFKAVDDATNTRTEVHQLFSSEGVWMKEEFMNKPDQIGGLAFGNAATYAQTGTGSVIGANSTSTMVGIWNVNTGAVSTNDYILYSAQNVGDGIFPAASATSYIYEVRFSLSSVANSYYAIGVQNAPPFSFAGPPGSGI